MSQLYFTPASISYLTQFLLALLISLYLGLRFFVVQRQQASRQDRLLALFFFTVTIFSLLIFLEASFLPSARLRVVYLENTVVGLLIASLIQFAYFFPVPREKQTLEQRLALIMGIIYTLWEAGFAVWRYSRLAHGQVEFRPEYMDLGPILGFAWVIFVFARNTLQNWQIPASRRFALIFTIPCYLAVANLLRAFYLLSAPFYHISMSAGILVTLFMFALNYLDAQPEMTSFMTKFSGAILTSLLAILGIIAWLIAPAYAARYTPSIVDHRTLRFTPNLDGGYDLREIPFYFEAALGEKLPLTEASDIRPALDISTFPFKFFGETYQQVTITKDGALAFGHGFTLKNAEYHLTPIPAIFGLLAEFNPEASPGGVYYRQEAGQLIVTYDRVRAFYWPENIYTFQIILRADNSFDLTTNGLPANLQYYPGDRADATFWVMGAKPAQAPSETVNFSALPFASGPAGLLHDEYLLFRQYLHAFLAPIAAMIFVSGLAFVVGLPILLRFSISRPLDALLKGVHALNEGHPETDIPLTSNDEIGYLTQSFNKMGREMNSLIKNLELRVAERTADLLAANEQLRKLSIAVEQSPNAVVITDLSANIEYVNPAFTRFTQYTFADAQGQNPRLLKSGRTPPQTYTAMWAALTAGETWRGDLCNRKKNGAFYWEYAIIAPIQDETGRTTHYAAINEDITSKKQAEEARREAELRYRSLYEQTHDAIFILDLEGHHLAANQRAADMLGYTLDELLQLSVKEVSVQTTESENVRQLLLAGKQVPLYERVFCRKDGRHVPVEINVELVRNAAGQPLHLQSVVRDITERKNAEAATLQFSQMLKDLNEVTMQLSLAPTFDDMCRLAIAQGQRKLGFDRLGLWFLDLSDPEYMFGSFGVDENGQIRDERQMRISTQPDEINKRLATERMYIYYCENDPTFNEQHQLVGYSDHAAVGLWDGNTVIGFLYLDNFITHRPITERQRELLMLFGQAIGHQGTIKRAQQHLEQLAIIDALTGLYNRRHFFIEAERVFTRAKCPHCDLTALMADIDHFKYINDTYGHQTGDIVLREVARRLNASLRPTDLIGRYGGEEFIAILPRTQCDNVGQVANRLIESINEKPIEANGFSISVTLSIGVAANDETITTLDDLLAEADRALYTAKQTGRNRWAFAAAPHPTGEAT